MQFLAQESRDVAHVDDVAEKESMWHAVRRSCEQKLKYSRGPEVHENVDKCKGIASKGEEAFKKSPRKLNLDSLRVIGCVSWKNMPRNLSLSGTTVGPKWQDVCSSAKSRQTQYSL